MQVTFCPGRGMSLKSYRSYFPGWQLVSEPTPIVVCHSRGIDRALEMSPELIVALDPAWFPENNPQIHIWVQAQRVVPEHVLNVHIYDEVTHYPYQVKRIRDEVVKFIQAWITHNEPRPESNADPIQIEPLPTKAWYIPSSANLRLVISL